MSYVTITSAIGSFRGYSLKDGFFLFTQIVPGDYSVTYLGGTGPSLGIRMQVTPAMRAEFPKLGFEVTAGKPVFLTIHVVSEGSMRRRRTSVTDIEVDSEPERERALWQTLADDPKNAQSPWLPIFKARLAQLPSAPPKTQ